MVQLNRIQLTNQKQQIKLKLLKSQASAIVKVELLRASTKKGHWISVLIDVKDTRDWQLGLKKKLKDSVMIFTLKTFPLRICLISVSKSAVLCGYVHIY